MAKKKKMKDKRRLQIKKKRRAERLMEKNKLITFICPSCKVNEDIPKDVVDAFDVNRMRVRLEIFPYLI